MPNSEDGKIKIARLETQMEQVSKQIEDLDGKIEKGFETITKELKCYAKIERVERVEKIVYGAVTVILTAFMTGLIYLVFK